MDKGKRIGGSCANVVKISNNNCLESRTRSLPKMVCDLKEGNPNSRSHFMSTLDTEEQMLLSEDPANEADFEITYINRSASENTSPRDTGLKIEECRVERLVEQFSNLQTIDENSGLEIQNRNACPSLIELKSCTACLNFDRTGYQDFMPTIIEQSDDNLSSTTATKMSNHEVLLSRPEMSCHDIVMSNNQKLSSHEVLKPTKSELSCHEVPKPAPSLNKLIKLSNSDLKLSGPSVEEILKKYDLTERSSDTADELMDLTNSYGTDYTITMKNDSVVPSIQLEQDSQMLQQHYDSFHMSEIVRYLEFKERMESRRNKTRGTSRSLQEPKVSSKQGSKIKKNNLAFKKLIVKESEDQGVGKNHRLSILYQTDRRFRHVASPVGLYIRNEVYPSLPTRTGSQEGLNVVSRRLIMNKPTSNEKFRNAKSISLPQITYEGSKYKIVGFETSAELPGPRDAHFKVKPEVLVHCYHKNSKMDSIPF